MRDLAQKFLNSEISIAGTKASQPAQEPSARLVALLCNAADNLADLPVSDAWASKWAKEAHALLEANNYFRASQPAPGARHRIPCTTAERICATPMLCYKNGCAQPAQGERQPVAVVDAGEDGLFVEILHDEDGSPLKVGDKLYRA